ncbi:MAG: ACT domain-containing protein [Allosphingosinicella sp.]
MSARIDIGFAPAEGAVLRMLGLVERRGFALRAVAMSEAEGVLSIDVEPRDAGRRLDVIAAQLRRLAEVRTVTTHEQGHSR